MGDDVSTVHKLKTWPAFYHAVSIDAKRFEIRKDDRNFQVGDTLLLQEWDVTVTGCYTGKELTRTITYILRGPEAEQLGLRYGYVALGLT